MSDRVSDRRARHTFWIDNRIIDTYAPILRRYSFGSAAIAVYAALARRANSDAEAWPSLPTIAAQAATSERTAQRAIRLLELLGLIEVTLVYEQASNRQTSSRYVLLSPPEVPPAIPTLPENWPPAVRSIIVVEGRGSRRPIRLIDPASADPVSTGHPPRCQTDAPPVSNRRPPGVSPTPLEGRSSERQTMNGEIERSFTTDDDDDDDDGRRAGTPALRRGVPADGRPTTTTTTTDDDDDGRHRSIYERMLAALVAHAAADPHRPAGMTPEQWAERLDLMHPGLRSQVWKASLRGRSR